MKNSGSDFLRSNVLGLVAIFIAIGGTAYAVDGPNPGQNTVGSEDIIGNEIKSDDLGNGRIFNLDIADEVITGGKLKDGTVTGSDLDESTLAKVPDSDELDGFDSTGFIRNQTGTTQPGGLRVDGTLRTTGMLRTGSETGTFDPPNYPSGSQGLVVRRIRAIDSTAGRVVARTDVLRLERAGTISGLRIAWDANPGQNTVSCIGVTSSDTVIPVHHDIDNPAIAGTATLYTVGQQLTKVDCQFGAVFDPVGHVTSVEMIRFGAGGPFYVGTLTSTFNQ